MIRYITLEDQARFHGRHSFQAQLTPRTVAQIYTDLGYVPLIVSEGGPRHSHGVPAKDIVEWAKLERSVRDGR